MPFYPLLLSVCRLSALFFGGIIVLYHKGGRNMDKSKVRIPQRFREHPIFNELICGTNFGFMAKRGYYDRPEVKKQPELMRKAGINWTSLNMMYCQDRYYSDKVYLDFEYSNSEREISETVKRLHDNGIRVMLKSNLTLLDGGWMGLVSFPGKGALSQIQGVEVDYWGKWFRSFTEAQKYFADFAERAGVDALMLGAEYFGTEGQNEYWEKVIDAVRGLYSNPITYEFTYRSRQTYDLEWIKKLDFLSYSYYPPACEPNVPELDDTYNPGARDIPSKTAEEMAEYLAPRKKRISLISERFDNMPVAFTEFGTRSAHGCIMQPWNFLWETYYDGEEQANFMEAAFRTFWELPEWMGFLWWKWDETQNRPQYHLDPAGDMGFTIQGKPAEEVMRRWLKKASERKLS